MEIRIKTNRAQGFSLDPVAELPGLNPDSTNYCEDLTKLVHVSVPQFPHH